MILRIEPVGINKSREKKPKEDLHPERRFCTRWQDVCEWEGRNLENPVLFRLLDRGVVCRVVTLFGESFLQSCWTGRAGVVTADQEREEVPVFRAEQGADAGVFGAGGYWVRRGGGVS